ncbi:MAG: hypothetical protein QOI66_1927 [Myxococcales bacterium]|jgi:hypothetical protein|nr:hypothetical protein [Myxococcales bacterium]
MAGEKLSASAYDFSAEAWSEVEGLQVKLVGTADMSIRDVLSEFLARVHQRALGDRVAEATLDLRQLVFMNSACLKELAVWIGDIQELPAADRYRIVLHSSPEILWQRRSLEALARLGDDLVTVRV